MPAQRTSRGFNFGIDTQLLATDSVVLHEADVRAAIHAIEDEAKQGDVLAGLRYGIVMSAVLWVALLFGGFLAFL
jgi:tetrahydromethanopterin S-methyltransferase subunit E